MRFKASGEPGFWQFASDRIDDSPTRELLPFRPELDHDSTNPGKRGVNWAGGYHPRLMTGIHITDIESAINYWRSQKPSADGFSLAPEFQELARVYAVMAFERQAQVSESDLSPAALEAWLTWYHTTPDTPCIAICSTSQGDNICKGCGRTFSEVQYWTEMRPAEKRTTWQRITQAGTAWRFNKYAERAIEGQKAPEGA